jgi:cytosine/adenosine deaminase-related metal-dependent hydrolase
VSRLSLVGGAVLVMDDADTVLPNGTVVIEDGRIADVVAGEVRHGRVFDCRGRLVTPGLVNAHAHLLESLFRGGGDGLGLLRWIAERSHPLVGALDEAGAVAASRLAAIEMLRSGTTASLDPEVAPGWHTAIGDAVAQAGVRCTLAIAVEGGAGYGAHGADVSQVDESRHSEHHPATAGHRHGLAVSNLDELDAALAPHPDSLIRTWIGPRVLSAVTPELGRAVAERTSAAGSGITFHCAEIPEDVAHVRSEHGQTPAEYARSVGLLGPSTVVAHGVHLPPSDHVLLAQAGSSVAHCPTSNARVGSGIAPIVAMREQGVNVALGTDGGMCNDTYDLMAEMRVASLIQKASRRDAGVMAPREVFGMATTGGARALGLDAGRLANGLLADCVVFDLWCDGSWPPVDPVDALVFGGGRAAVELVVVAGEVRVSAGEVVGIDTDRVYRDAREAAIGAIERSGIGDEIRPRWAPHAIGRA